jgi:2-amino-4-hydroxy-6-hydroxymethyldihydropteridine diphosphokinase
MALVGIALGSNLGKKLANLRAARDLLKELMPLNARMIQAPLYQTAAINCPADSPDFFNTVVEMSFNGSPQQLLRKTRAIEKLLGRPEKTILNEPRVIDVDLLYFDDLIIDTPELEIPHPRMAERRFVLEPLSEICPHRVLPKQDLTILELLQELDKGKQPIVTLQSSW